MIPITRYWFLLFLVALVYVAGMLVTLLENDSAQFAVMAMRMVQEQDFFTLMKGTEEYLDKPHMHYWLAALSFSVFGIHDWAYRIPALLVTFLGAYSCYGLGRLLYNKTVGQLAALILITAQTIVLSVIDVRTDAVLMGFTIFAIWQLVTYIESNTLQSALLGALGAGLAFSTKGQIALVVIGVSLLCHVAYTRKWKAVLHWKVGVALLVFALTISPMLYAYYLQFDLHPEKIIRGKNNRSGIFFIFWEQSFERLSGEGVGKNSSDFFFFFHTFLWVFLPWTVLALLAYGSQVKRFWKLRFAYRPSQEFLTLGGITLLFFLISFAQFKLPHYINILIPLYALLSAAYLHHLYQTQNQKLGTLLLRVQYGILGVVWLFVFLVCGYVFPATDWYSYGIVIVLLAITEWCWRQKGLYWRIVILAVGSSLVLNGVLNTHFYPRLLQYQAGSTMAEKIVERGIPAEAIYKLSKRHTWALDFYTQSPVKIVAIPELREKGRVWVYATDAELAGLRRNGYRWEEQITVDQFRITRLQLPFLNPSTRAEKLSAMHLVQVY